ncbi:MAG: hypothetical protein KC593_03890 [Myxococcales bacterium]|nr:hypothetical protein [Myxococcales bacterium]MCB9627032.1 hypothetical protein [Sandaracinaceae bacterium]
MRWVVRDVAGGALVVASLVTCFEGLMRLRAHDYLAAVVVLMVGLALLGAGVELLRPTVGE